MSKLAIWKDESCIGYPLKFLVPRLQLVRAPCLKFNSRLAHKWVMGIMPVEFTSNVIREPLLFRIRSKYFRKRKDMIR